jgi:serine/threonine-protein kinase
VLVSRHGEVKLSDFGVARALRDAVVAHTQTVAGHISYMAPEQARGESVDTRSDLFPLGVVVWELLVGRRLFRRENEAATLMALLSEKIPSPSTIRPELDPAWDAFVASACARDVARRFASAREMRAALARIPDAAAKGGERWAAQIADILAAEPESETASDDVSTQVITSSST